MRFIGNLIWLLFGGLETALAYFVASCILIVTIVGIPFGMQTLKLGLFTLWPFGQEAVAIKHRYSLLNFVMNIFWFLMAGIWIALMNILFGILLCITIIGIPFGMQHFKLAMLAIRPFGREIVNRR